MLRASNRFNKLLEMRFKFPVNPIGKLTMAFLTGQSWDELKSWYIGVDHDDWLSTGHHFFKQLENGWCLYLKGGRRIGLDNNNSYAIFSFRSSRYRFSLNECLGASFKFQLKG